MTTGFVYRGIPMSAAEKRREWYQLGAETENVFMSRLRADKRFKQVRKGTKDEDIKKDWDTVATLEGGRSCSFSVKRLGRAKGSGKYNFEVASIRRDAEGTILKQKSSGLPVSQATFTVLGIGKDNDEFHIYNTADLLAFLRENHEKGEYTYLQDWRVEDNNQQKRFWNDAKSFLIDIETCQEALNPTIMAKQANGRWAQYFYKGEA